MLKWRNLIPLLKENLKHGVIMRFFITLNNIKTFLHIMKPYYDDMTFFNAFYELETYDDVKVH